MDINETNASVTLNQKKCGVFFTNKEDQLRAVKREEQIKKRRNTMGRVVSGRAITENGVAKKVQEHIENIRNKQLRQERILRPSSTFIQYL